MEIIDVFGVKYCLDPENNSKIVPFSWFVNQLKSNNWEADTFAVFKRVANKNKIAIDLGAWIGSTSIWLSKNFRSVISVDADKIAVEALKKNLLTSSCDNVKVINSPVFNERQMVNFGVNEHLDGPKLGDSTSQIRAHLENQSNLLQKSIKFVDLATHFSFDEVSFVKVDIEGGEEFILTDVDTLAKKYKWKLWISFHCDWWSDRKLSALGHLFIDSTYVGTHNKKMKLTQGRLKDYLIKNPFASIYIEY